MALQKAEGKESKEETKITSKKKEYIQVVDKLPVQEIRRIEQEDKIINLITIEEALTSLLNGNHGIE